MSTILLRLSNEGAPVAGNLNNGVLILPSVAIKPGHKEGDQLFTLKVHLDAASKVTREGVLHINAPKDADPASFERQNFQHFPIRSSFDKDVSINVPIYNAGTYCFYTSYKDGNNEEQKTSEYYFNVPPQLSIDGDWVPFNAISMQSVISKWVGPLNDWDAFFADVSAKGYNMIHFTPLQERGSSDSPYSIYDQLRFDPHLFGSNKEAIDFIGSTLKKNKLLALTDVVWNHTADNSAWLRDAPDAGYNAETAPHLTAAIELDKRLLEFSGALESHNLPTDIKSAEDITAIMDGIDTHVVRKMELWQYYVFDKDSIIKSIEKLANDGSARVSPVELPPDVNVNDLKSLSAFVLRAANANSSVILGDRFANKLDDKKLFGIILSVLKTEGTNADAIVGKARAIVDEINADLYATYDDDVKSIKAQLRDRIRFLRLDDNGPKMGPVTDEKPLIETYFTRFQDKNGKEWALANNGWIWGGNPLVDFASAQSKAYLRREVIVWSDCVKLRYGEGPEDSPALWKRMIEYTKLCASTFCGFRLDNCHSTPLHVGEALLDAARSVNPNLYVVAELFSGSEEMDKVFVERLGINSLIREAMQAWTVGELSRLVHKHGGRPIGSFTWLPLDDFAYPAGTEPDCNKFTDSYSELEIPKVLNFQAPHALFMDCTHDNELPAQKRTVEDTLPNAALVAFCSSAIGTNFGYDECYPALLNVVSEKRQYTYGKNGIGSVKRKLNDIRKSLAKESEDIGRDHEMYIHHEGQYITIQRYNARTGKGWFLIARSKFSDHEENQVLSPCILGGTSVKAEFAYTLKKTGEYKKDDKKLTGIPVHVEDIPLPSIEVSNSDAVITVDESFVPGSIAVFSTAIPKVDSRLDKFVRDGAVEASKNLDLFDLNALLYKCEPEERDASGGHDSPYTIPGHGTLVYAGLQGWISALKHVVWENDLGAAICDHLREGEWALDYVVNRLDKYAQNSKNLGQFQEWLRTRMDAIRVAPYFLRPHYFALVVGAAYEACRFRALRQLGSNIQSATNFVQTMALTSVQFVGYMNNTSLLPFDKVPSMSAGLPHFSNDYMRCWGRDIFIAFRGHLIATERYDDAKQHILGFAKTLKHGLIPNLLDAGRNPRYNARDAAWFFLQSVQEYVERVPHGEKILDEEVSRRFPLDDTYIPYDDEKAFSYKTSIRDIIYEILQRHAAGISYREANAGSNLDSQMKDEGFNVKVHIDWETGLVHGGSQANCGTWMDKMGESEKAGSKGVPGTPRDGAAVELQGLLKSALRFVNKLKSQGLFEQDLVKKDDGTTITFKEWEQLVQDNFERCFYIPEDPQDDGKYEVDSSLVNRRGIYKDLFRSGKPYEDYQLRANFPIAMVVAPELFSPQNALKAIDMADAIIRGPVGMRTLDPSDYNYRPYYNNGEDSSDFATSKGRNYHQGPEWVWCFGYFIRAFLHFHVAADREAQLKNGPLIQILTAINDRLQGHRKWIRESPWAGLTELTNKDGEICHDSSPTQAWSTSCLVDLYYDLWMSS